MIREIEKIKRDLEDRKSNDIIRKKYVLEKMFKEDPDIIEILGQREKMPLNKFLDKDNPTEEELKKRQEILDYNEKVDHRQIVPFLKLNNIQKEVANFLMFDIDDNAVSYVNNTIKNQHLIVMCLVHEDDMDTEYGITRADLLSYLVKDLLNWSNVLGMQLKLINDFNDIIDSKYYCRTLKFLMEVPNGSRNHGVGSNSYDRFNI